MRSLNSPPRYSRSNAMPTPSLVLYSGRFGPILDIVGEYFGVDLVKNRRFRTLVFPRQTACYLIYIYTDLSLSEIGKGLGYETPNAHSIILHSIKAVRSLCKHDSNIRRQVIELETMIENG